MLDHLQDLRLRYPRPVDPLALSSHLRRRYPAQQAIWLQQQLEGYWDALRLEAFEDPLPLLYEPEALQMASRWPLARRRALQMSQLFPPGLWLEIGAGIGGDTLELARVNPLRIVEANPLRAEMLEHNLRVVGLRDRVEIQVGDAREHPQWLEGVVALYADPARRNQTGRQWKDLQPDPSWLWSLSLPTCLKLAPGIDERSLPQGANWEYCSHQDSCKEVVVWTGVAPFGVRAWRYALGHWRSLPRREPPPVAAVEPGMWLHEPDPAAIRAQGWPLLEGWRIDESLALLASAPGVSDPWCRSFELLEIAEADLKSLKRLQKRLDFHPLEIKKRGFEVDPERLRRQLPKGQRGGPGVLWLTRVEGRHCCLVCRRIPTLGD